MSADLAERLRRFADEADAVAAKARALAEEVEREGALPPPPRERFVTTGVACKIVGRSESWLYKNVTRFPNLGHKTATNVWAWRVSALRDLVECEGPSPKKTTACEDYDAAHLPPP